jgi:hypothetical protein
MLIISRIVSARDYFMRNGLLIAYSHNYNLRYKYEDIFEMLFDGARKQERNRYAPGKGFFILRSYIDLSAFANKSSILHGRSGS